MLISVEPSYRVARDRALLIEPDDTTRRALQIMLEGCRLEVRSFAAATPALADFADRNPHVLCVAHILPDGDGPMILCLMRQRGWEGRAILITDMGSQRLIDAADDAGFAAVLDKPVGRLELINALVR